MKESDIRNISVKMKNLSFITRKFKKSSNFNKDSDFIMLEGDTLKNISLDRILEKGFYDLKH